MFYLEQHQICLHYYSLTSVFPLTMVTSLQNGLRPFPWPEHLKHGLTQHAPVHKKDHMMNRDHVINREITWSMFLCIYALRSFTIVYIIGSFSVLVRKYYSVLFCFFVFSWKFDMRIEGRANFKTRHSVTFSRLWMVVWPNCLYPSNQTLRGVNGAIEK